MKNTANVERMMRRLPFPTVIVLPAQLGITALQTTGCDLGGMLGLHFTNNFRLRSRWHAKRALDYALTIPTFLCSLPLLVFFAAWIKLVSPGPVFYAQTRIGLGGKRFRMWKLRTMHTDAEQRLQQLLENDPESREEWERYCKLKRDPRVIPGIGQFLRKSSIDELPQLWNVLRGDMSLVGPRPLPDYHLDRFSTEFRALRRQVLPGLTGMWQVLARNAGDLPVQEACDTYYITNWSGWLDLYLLGQTLHAVLTRRSAY